jgi:hypothetical protein
VNQQLFLYINIILVIVFAVLFWIGRRSALKNNPQFKMTLNLTPKKSNLNPSVKVIGETLGDLNAENIKSLNVIFVYNGHTWDAYEILGVKPGSSIAEIKEAFEKAIENNGAESHEFLKTALAAVFQSLKSQGFDPK